MLTIEEKYNNMKIAYRECQRKNKELIKLLSEYDGSHAGDEWDVNLMPSREWVNKINKAVKNG